MTCAVRARGALALALLFGGSAGAAERTFTPANAPEGLKALMAAHRDGADGCELVARASATTVVATVHALDAQRSLLIMPCMTSRKFDVERVFVMTGDDFAGAQPARLPVPKVADPPHERRGYVSDAMQVAFDARRKLLWSSTWTGGSCWRQRSWIWKGGRFVRVTNATGCADG